jgi:hypothetical protein
MIAIPLHESFQSPPMSLIFGSLFSIEYHFSYHSSLSVDSISDCLRHLDIGIEAQSYSLNLDHYSHVDWSTRL